MVVQKSGIKGEYEIEMDLIMVAFDSLIIISYLVFIIFISPFIMRFLKNKNYDLVIQMLPVLFIVLVSSVAIATIGYEGFKDTLFFRLVSIVSLLFLFILLLILVVKSLWKEKYEKVAFKLNSIRKKIGKSFSHK